MNSYRMKSHTSISNLLISHCRRGRQRLAAIWPVLAMSGAMLFFGEGCFRSPENQKAGKFPEQLVYARSTDDVVNAGVFFAATNDSGRSVAVIWIHGWGVNFYQPTYVRIGRATAERGYAFISGNTRMHDLGNVTAWRDGKRIRGGGYWGVASEEVRDLAAWVDFAEDRGFKHVVLVGHSAGWAAVRSYQSQTRDPRVIGVVLASGAVRPETGPTDPDQLAQATRLMAEGEGDALVRDPKRSFPSYISAATFLDIARTLPESKDFFGIQMPDPGVTRIHCPLLAFFGTRGDVGNEKDLEVLKSSLARLSSGPSSVQTTMISGADHMYASEERQVARVIATWADTLSP